MSYIKFYKLFKFPLKQIFGAYQRALMQKTNVIECFKFKLEAGSLRSTWFKVKRVHIDRQRRLFT